MSVIKGQNVVVRILGQFLPEFSGLGTSENELVWELPGEGDLFRIIELMIQWGYLDRQAADELPAVTARGREIFDGAKIDFALEIELAQVLADLPVGLDLETVQSLKDGTYEGD